MALALWRRGVKADDNLLHQFGRLSPHLTTKERVRYYYCSPIIWIQIGLLDSASVSTSTSCQSLVISRVHFKDEMPSLLWRQVDVKLVAHGFLNARLLSAQKPSRTGKQSFANTKDNFSLVAIMALKLVCDDIPPEDIGRGDERTPEYHPSPRRTPTRIDRSTVDSDFPVSTKKVRRALFLDKEGDNKTAAVGKRHTGFEGLFSPREVNYSILREIAAIKNLGDHPNIIR